MIYIIDDFVSDSSHGNLIEKIILTHSNSQIRKVNTETELKPSKLQNIIFTISCLVKIDDIVLIPWVTERHLGLDTIVESLANKCRVVVAAGNFSTNIENYSPTCAKNVIVVGCYNKSLKKATLSNYSENINMMWVVGTNYFINNIPHNGTSISSALYTAFLYNEIIGLQPINDSIKEYHDSVKI